MKTTYTKQECDNFAVEVEDIRGSEGDGAQCS